jgi:hypothetical protein
MRLRKTILLFLSIKRFPYLDRGKKWKVFLNRWHVYGGLFTIGFLLVFSYSAFYHQHHPKTRGDSHRRSTWEQKIAMPEIEDGHAYKLAVRDSMGLFGHAPWWEDYHDSLGIHHFMITRPGKQYWVTVPRKGDLFSVEEIRTGFLNVLVQLHPLSSGLMEGPFFIRVWKFIAFPMALVLLGVIMITVHFWYVRSFKNSGSWLIVLIIAAVPITLTMIIWLVG